MKYIKFTRIFSIAIILSLITALLPSVSVLAAGEELFVRPNHGEIGGEIEISGTGFISTIDYDLYFASTRVSIDSLIDQDILNYEFLLNVDIDNITSSFVEAYCNIPPWLRDGRNDEKVLGGRYYIYATKENLKTIVARVEFTVDAVASISSITPTTGAVGTEVLIDGEGYNSSEALIVEFDGVAVSIIGGDTATDSNGIFNNTKIIVPASIAGTHTITVAGDDSNLEAQEQFTVTPYISISPDSGPPGTLITVNGSGFGSNVIVSINFNDSAGTPSTTNGVGSFTASFDAPVIIEGISIIKAIDASSNSDVINFSVQSTSVTLVPNKGKIGATVAVTGSGFIKSKEVIITFDGDIVATAKSDTSGSISTSFTVPTAKIGDYIVAADDGINKKEIKFAITSSTEISPVTSDSSPGNIGSQITVSGMGFTAAGTVVVNYDGTQVASTIADANGNFSVSFDAPASIGGTHTIVAAQGTNTQAFNYYVETTAPAIPSRLLPETAAKSSAQASFDWNDVTDPSGVTYKLQIATDNTFSASSFVLEKTNITKSQYTLTRAERLNSVSKEAPYYWRVKAMDNASNESGWSSAGTFYVGFSFGIPQPVIYVIIGICALLLAGFAFWMGRKTAYY